VERKRSGHVADDFYCNSVVLPDGWDGMEGICSITELHDIQALNIEGPILHQQCSNYKHNYLQHGFSP